MNFRNEDNESVPIWMWIMAALWIVMVGGAQLGLFT